MAIYQLNTEIEIDASADRVWAVLTDFASFPDWNPFIRSAAGEVVKGARLNISVQPNGAKAMRFTPTVLVAEEGRELCWLGRFLFPGVFDGEHRFVIEPLGGQKVVFRQSERFSGFLVGPFRSGLERDTRQGFEEMNRALKARAETGELA